MLYRIVCVGRRAQDPILDAIEDYTKRIARYSQIEVIRVREATLREESKVLLKHVDKKIKLDNSV